MGLDYKSKLKETIKHFQTGLAFMLPFLVIGAMGRIIPILFGAGDPNAGLPPRLGYFVAREMLGHCLSHHGVKNFAETFPKFEELFRTILERGSLDACGPEGTDVQK